MYDACCAGRETAPGSEPPLWGLHCLAAAARSVSSRGILAADAQGFTAPTGVVFGWDHDSSFAKEEAYAEQQMRLSAAATVALQALAQQHHLSMNTLVQEHGLCS